MNITNLENSKKNIKLFFHKTINSSITLIYNNIKIDINIEKYDNYYKIQFEKSKTFLEIKNKKIICNNFEDTLKDKINILITKIGYNEYFISKNEDISFFMNNEKYLIYNNEFKLIKYDYLISLFNELKNIKKIEIINYINSFINLYKTNNIKYINNNKFSFYDISIISDKILYDVLYFKNIIYKYDDNISMYDILLSNKKIYDLHLYYTINNINNLTSKYQNILNKITKLFNKVNEFVYEYKDKINKSRKLTFYTLIKIK